MSKEWAERFRAVGQAALAHRDKQNAIMPNQCFCIGPQNGEPVCPCRMRFMTIRAGRYVEVIDHGPVREPELESVGERVAVPKVPNDRQ